MSDIYGELVPVGGGDPIPLFKAQLTIGRRPTCDICLPFPNVSSQHCQLEIQNGYWHVRDMDSRNGIKINGERDESRFLLPGDELSVAKNVYIINYEPESDAPPPQVDKDPFSKSLMEKAGLSKSRNRKTTVDEEASGELMGDVPERPVKRPPTKTGNQLDDNIMEWLSDE